MTMQWLTAAAAALILTGCSHPPTQRLGEIQTVKIAVPVACLEPVPIRPHMPTEELPPDANVDEYVQAAAAEIERREGYETLLATALDNCRRTLE